LVDGGWMIDDAQLPIGVERTVKGHPAGQSPGRGSLVAALFRACCWGVRWHAWHAAITGACVLPRSGGLVSLLKQACRKGPGVGEGRCYGDDHNRGVKTSCLRDVRLGNAQTVYGHRLVTLYPRPIPGVAGPPTQSECCYLPLRSF
jgi:hypothetical protein